MAAELAPLQARQGRASAPSIARGRAGRELAATASSFEIVDQPRRAVRAAGPDRPGGELSRFMLASKVALADAGGGRTTMIFDEVDRGVGGAVAGAVGERLHRLG